MFRSYAVHPRTKVLGFLANLDVRKRVKVKGYRNKLVIDINENNVSCMAVDLDKGKATLFRVNHDIKGIRVKYRLIRMGVQRRLGNDGAKPLLRKYGARERHMVEDRLKKIAKRLADIAEAIKADVVVENLELRREKVGKLKARQLNYRLNALPYKKLLTYVGTEFNGGGLKVHKVPPNWSSLECPLCRNRDVRNRMNAEEFRCTKCGFTLNSHYVAALNLYSRFNDGIAIRGRNRALYMVPRSNTSEAAPLVSVDEAPNDPMAREWVLRGKTMPKFIKKILNSQNNLGDGHGRPRSFSPLKRLKDEGG
ncbi:transposase [Candidatus Bathyarchaeota archaeon]|nr:transposase [Candidatus Bathyarchaeota archaeon]MBS7617916.1 transposase [Candidatus Bathyarchaeota archaeon]